MKIQILFLEGLRPFRKTEKKQIQQTVTAISKDAAKLLGIATPVVFTIFKEGKIVNGYTAANDWVRISMPTGKYSIKELQANIYHELNHVARGYSESANIKNHLNLLDVIVAEGLGTWFEMEMVKGIPFPHGNYEVKELIKVFKRLKKELNNSNYNHYEWFFGAGKVPNQFGYKMGKYIIDQVLEHNPKLSIKELTKLATKKIWKLSNITLD